MSIFDKFKKKKDIQEKKPRVSEMRTEIVKEKNKITSTKPAGKKNVGQKSRPVQTHKQTDKIIVKPIISEKATLLNQYGKYLFEVSTKANRIEISKAVQAIYGVMPVKVNIMNVSGKQVQYGRSQGSTKDWKKAIVTLKEGDTIKVNDEV